jgi:hypothetical protein
MATNSNYIMPLYLRNNMKKPDHGRKKRAPRTQSTAGDGYSKENHNRGASDKFDDEFTEEGSTGVVTGVAGRLVALPAEALAASECFRFAATPLRIRSKNRVRIAAGSIAPPGTFAQTAYVGTSLSLKAI